MKLRNNKGETLVEVLAAIVVASLSVALLFGCVLTSSNMDQATEDADDPYYQALSAADSQADDKKMADDGYTVEIARVKPTTNAEGKDIYEQIGYASSKPGIDIYGDKGVYSYTYKDKFGVVDTGP